MHVKSAAGAGGSEQAEARPRRLKADQAEATRAALLEAATELFAQRGYAGVATEEIVRAAGLTRGALYHHFAGKLELFEAVYEQVEQGLVERIASSAMSAASGSLAALRAGARAFLDACEDPAVQRIALLDAPSVLGWERWREIGLRYAFGLVQGTVAGAMLIARAHDDGRTRAQVGDAVDRFLDMLRPRE